MKHLFNDLSSQEKNRIMEMHKTASDNLYLSEQPTVQPPRYTGRPMAGMSSGNPTLQTAIDALNSLETDSTMFIPYFNDMMNALLASKNGNNIKNLKIAIDAISKLSDTDRKALLNSKLGVDENKIRGYVKQNILEDLESDNEPTVVDKLKTVVDDFGINTKNKIKQCIGPRSSKEDTKLSNSPFCKKVRAIKKDIALLFMFAG